VATNGEKAIENAAAMGGVDLLITDVVMEPMDGFILRDELTARYPKLRTILMSGYDLSDYPTQIQNHQLLQKPIEAGTILAAVQSEIQQIAAASAPQPRAAAVVAAVPQARAAVAQPRAVAAAPAAVVQAPIAAPAAAVRPAARASVQTQPFIPAPAPAPIEAAIQVDGYGGGTGESLIGQTLGAYQILSYLGEGRLGSAYAAVQISINRPVGLKVLDPSRAQDEAVKARFIADARAKAHVQHPSTLAVYEAGQSQGRFFYAREYVDGQSLAEMAQSRRGLEEQTAIKLIRTVAEGFVYLHLNNIPHRPLDPTKIFVGMDGLPRLANLAVQVTDQHMTIEQEIQSLGRIVSPLAVTQSTSSGLNNLVSGLIQSPSSGITAWGQVIQAAKALEPKVVPVEAARITAQDRAAEAVVQAARKQQRRAFWINVASLSLLFLAVVFLALRKFVFTNERKIQKMVKIPAGTYKLPGNKTVVIEKDFWMDKYEVTIGQYQRFLDFLDRNPTADQDFRHPRMPRHLEHRPPDWAIYHGQAKVNGKAHSTPIDLNCPALTVTWWDAYAYAKWLGSQNGTEQDLPTAEEWEVAAAGDKAYRFPWGNDFEKDKVNSNADHKANNPGAPGAVDGFNFWNPVDAIKGDQSEFGVYGLGGNVAEWTATWSADNRFPVVKGGSFNKGTTPIDKSIVDRDPSTREEWIGFRTISRTPPPNED
jgi:formylglycine-generating enzyme required for sulfatase activity/CheY-like chemotaxis protein